jgi:hypothetical protein
VNPRPTVSIQAVVTAVALEVAAVFGPRVAALAFAVALVAVGATLDIAYHQRIRASSRVSPERRRLDRLMRGLYLLPVTVPAVTALALTVARAADFGPPSVQAISLIVAAAPSAILVSSVFDWFWVVPRIAGVVRPGPWETPNDPFWRSVTLAWLLSRSLTAITVSAAVVAVPLVSAAMSDGNVRTAWLAFAAVLAGAVSPSLRGLGAALNPPVSIGDLFRLEDGVILVVDVSLQGAGYVYVGAALRRNASEVVVKDGVLAFDDLPQLRRVTTADVGWGDPRVGDHLRWESTRRLEAVDALDVLIDSAAAERQRAEERTTAKVKAGATLMVVLTVLSAAAAAAEVAVSARSSVTAVVLAGAVVAAAALTSMALLVRRRLVARQQLRSSALVSPSLLAFGEQVNAQRRGMRDGLTRGRTP